MQSTNTVTVYGCGGTGIELLTKVLKTDLSSFAQVRQAFVDGSRSNVSQERRIEEDKWYFLEGVDGAGKIRKSNYEVTDRSISDILFKLKPSDLNLVIFSASGGSGSVIGPKIVEALYAQGKAVILFVVGSTESYNTTDNTLKTLYSIDGIARKQNAFANVCFDSNENNTRNDLVDATMVNSIRAVLDLYSGLHHGIDTADVLTWARPVLGAGVSPQLGLLDIFSDRKAATEIVAPISVAELYGEDKTNEGTIGADYNTYGTRKDGGQHSLYFMIFTHGLDKLVSELKDTLNEFEQRKIARDRQNRNGIGSGLGGGESDGMQF